MDNQTPQRKLLIKKEAEGTFGKPPEDRSTAELLTYGVINLDKPKGPTSHQVSDYVKKILPCKRAGHSGTLDPGVTGVQPVAIGKATRITQFLLTAPKEYVGIMHLHKDITEETLKKAAEQFVGKILQLPPVKSAVKRQLREREIYAFEILEMKGREVLFRVRCQAGTYVRKFCLHPQTAILTTEGSLSASDFFSYHPNVYSYHRGKMIEKKPSATQKIPSPTKLVKITISSGVSFIVTPDHELLASLTEGYKMVEAQALKEGDYLVKSLMFPNHSKEYVIADLLDDNYLIQQEEIKEQCKRAFITKYGSIRAMYRALKLDRKTFLPHADYAITIRHLKLAGIYEKVKKNLHTFKTQKGTIIDLKELNENFFYLLGLIASDGNNTKEKKTERYTRIKFHNNEEALINKFLAVYEKLFPSIPISKKKVTAKLWQLDTSNSLLATIAASLGVKSPQKKSSLAPLLNVTEDLIRSFLRGYFDGDGSIYHKKTPTNDKSKICIHTISCGDAVTLHKMLLKVGIPNKIFKRDKKIYESSLVKKRCTLYDVTIGNIPAEKKFIKEIGTMHPKKAKKFKELLDLKYEAGSDDHLYLGLHYKEEIRKNKSRLYSLGGNVSRILGTKVPITRAFYKKASKRVSLPILDEFIIEKINSIEIVRGGGYVYDLTVPETHNFLIETGFVSSNCHDLGKALGSGAHMAELRRTQAGPFTEKDHLVTLQDLLDAYHYYKEENNEKFLRYCLQPIEKAVEHLPKCWLFDSTLRSVSHGRDIGVPGISKLEEFPKGALIALLTLKNELVAIGEAQMPANEIHAQEKGLAIVVKKVFLEAM
ncbi:MAG: LAGLIDADG family homing endonuclease [Nanoarchaeota archaeon]|nr:LAGLIDADG family homing endonuclease [Nanoarchaeota archaeon]